MRWALSLLLLGSALLGSAQIVAWSTKVGQHSDESGGAISAWPNLFAGFTSAGTMTLSRLDPVTGDLVWRSVAEPGTTTAVVQESVQRVHLFGTTPAGRAQVHTVCRQGGIQHPLQVPGAMTVRKTRVQTDVFDILLEISPKPLEIAASFRIMIPVAPRTGFKEPGMAQKKSSSPTALRETRAYDQTGRKSTDQIGYVKKLPMKSVSELKNSTAACSIAFLAFGSMSLASCGSSKIGGADSGESGANYTKFQHEWQKQYKDPQWLKANGLQIFLGDFGKNLRYLNGSLPQNIQSQVSESQGYQFDLGESNFQVVYLNFQNAITHNQLDSLSRDWLKARSGVNASSFGAAGAKEQLYTGEYKTSYSYAGGEMTTVLSGNSGWFVNHVLPPSGKMPHPNVQTIFASMQGVASESAATKKIIGGVKFLLPKSTAIKDETISLPSSLAAVSDIAEAAHMTAGSSGNLYVVRCTAKEGETLNPDLFMKEFGNFFANKLGFNDFLSKSPERVREGDGQYTIGAGGSTEINGVGNFVGLWVYVNGNDATTVMMWHKMSEKENSPSLMLVAGVQGIEKLNLPGKK